MSGPLQGHVPQKPIINLTFCFLWDSDNLINPKITGTIRTQPLGLIMTFNCNTFYQFNTFFEVHVAHIHNNASKSNQATFKHVKQAV